jgi:uncharacterized DUF497 family protein
LHNIVATINIMKFIFDLEKNRKNIEKHGVALQEAENLNWEEGIFWVDDRKNYREQRWVGLVPLKRRLHYVVYVILESTR